MSQRPTLEVTLFDNTHCPYSERARRALGEKGIYQRRIGFRWHLRDWLASETGHQAVPVLHDEKRFVGGSGAIARYADRLNDDAITLFPAAHVAGIAAWERRANEMATFAMPLVIPVWADVLADDEERAAFLACHQRYGAPDTLTRDRLRHWDAVMATWREVDAALAQRDYLLGPLTYADLAVYGSVYLAAQFHAFEVPQALERLAAWYETIRTAGLMRDQELLLGHSRPEQGRYQADFTRGSTRYGDPPHHPEESGRETY